MEGSGAGIGYRLEEVDADVVVVRVGAVVEVEVLVAEIEDVAEEDVAPQASADAHAPIVANPKEDRQSPCRAAHLDALAMQGCMGIRKDDPRWGPWTPLMSWQESPQR